MPPISDNNNVSQWDDDYDDDGLCKYCGHDPGQGHPDTGGCEICGEDV